jgi:ABC-type amino acid transport substrate-binding protein
MKDFRLSKFILPILVLFATCYASQIQARDTLRVGHHLQPPFVVNSMEQELNGPSVWLWEHLAKDKGLVYEYIPMTLEELLRGLETNTIDVCLSPLTITADRSKTIDFTAPYHIAYATMMQPQLNSLQKAWRFISSFFSLNFLRALAALAFVILIFGLLIWLFERKRNQEEFGGKMKGIWEGFWWSAVTMTTVGYGDKSPRTVGGRIVSLIWMFTAIMIISGFTASIASSLTMDSIGANHSDLEDFKELKLGTIDNSVTSEWLKTHFFYNKKEFIDIDQMLKALDNKEIDAIAFDQPVLQTIVNTDTTSHYELEDIHFNPQFYAFGMSKELPLELREEINHAMLINIEKMEWKVLLAEMGLD